VTRLAAVAAAVLAAVAVAVPAPAGAQSDEADLRVVSQTPWVVPGGTMAVRLRVEGAPPGAELRASLRNRVRTRSEFARAVEGQGLRSELGEQVVALDGAPTDADGAVTVRLPTGTLLGEDPVATLTQPGVYPVDVELADADGEILDGFVTMLVRLAEPDPDRYPISAAVVVPLHAPPAHVGPGELDTAALARLRVTLDALVEHPDVALTVAATPESVAGALDADPAAAGQLAAALRGRQVLGGPWVRLDEGAWSSAGLREELDRQLEAGAAALARVAGVRPDLDTALVPDGGGDRAVGAFAERGVDVVVVDGDERPDLVEHFAVTELPTLVVVEDHVARARLERPRGCREIERLLAPWLN